MTNEEIHILKSGGIGVMPTDTLYGVLGQALLPQTVQRIYDVKGRNSTKPLIVLISDFSDLALFGVEMPLDLKNKLESYWPGPVSIILPTKREDLEYLHRGTHTIALRLPNEPLLQEILREVGPLVAPSANPEGKPPATTIEEARNYFGDRVDFYHDGGVRAGSASKLISLVDGELKVLRP